EGLICHQQLDHHPASGLGATGLRLDFHPRRRRANTARGQDALALDLDHADAAVAVGPVTGLGRIAQMRQFDAEAASGAEDRLTCADIDVAIIDREYIHHHSRKGSLRSCGKYFSTLSNGFGAACPRPQMEASRMASESSVNNVLSHGPDAISLTAFSVPTRHGVHWPQLSS